MTQHNPLNLASNNQNPIARTAIDEVKILLASRFCVRKELFLDGTVQLVDASKKRH